MRSLAPMRADAFSVSSARAASRSAADLEAARAELTQNASARIGVSDRILDGPI